VKLDPGAHVFYAFGFALKSGCDSTVARSHHAIHNNLVSETMAGFYAVGAHPWAASALFSAEPPGPPPLPYTLSP
jgi:hypothetical protein